jgi:outer membrane protein assembly factor BamB
VPEASGAAWLTIDDKLRLVVVGDSGNDGAYGLVDPETGATTETGRLPLSSAAGDDIEGLASRDGKLYGLTSAGWMRVWQRTSGGSARGSPRDMQNRFELIGGPYPIGPVDLPDKKNQSRPPEGDGMVCGARAGNCGRNYEGLCLAPTPRGPCVGFAASKADGHLYCLTDDAGKLVVHHDRAIAITRPGALADCAFSDDDTLWAGSNLFDLGHVYRVAHWEDPAAAQVEQVATLIVGFPEVIAARGDVVYRMSDTNGAPSLMARYRCR